MQDSRQATDQLADFLSQVPLFSALEASQLAALGRSSSQASVAAGAYLFRRGDHGDALYVVEAGLMEALIDEPGQPTRIVATFGPGEFFGEVALLLGEARSATMQARVDSRLIVLDRPDFEALLRENPQIALSINRALSRRLLDTNDQISPRATRVSVIVPNGDDDAATEAALQVLESLDRQLRTTSVLVLFGLPVPPVLASGRLPATAQDVVVLATARGHVVPVPQALTAGSLDAEARDLLGNLRRRFSHVLALVAPSVARQHAALLERADVIIALACADRALPDAVHLQHELQVHGRRSVELGLLGPAQHAPSPIPLMALDYAETLAASQGRLSDTHRRAVDRLARALAGARIGLALSGGAAQGVAHLGVLDAVLGAGIPVDLIAGTSGGALYGALVAAGVPIREAQQYVIASTRHNLWDRLDIGIPRSGLIRGRRIEAMIRDIIGDVTFADLVIPLYAVAAELGTGAQVVLNRGKVYQAVRASISVPGLFEPLVLHGRTLVDGGVVNPLPVNVAREGGADYVIAVQVPPPGKVTEEQRLAQQQRPRYNLISTVMRSYYFAADMLASASAGSADALIRPNVADFGWRDYRAAADIIARGREAGADALSTIAGRLPVRI